MLILCFVNFLYAHTVTDSEEPSSLLTKGIGNNLCRRIKDSAQHVLSMCMPVPHTFSQCKGTVLSGESRKGEMTGNL